MSSKPWNETELDKTSAELDAELEEIFAEVDRSKRRPALEASLPQAEILPDEYDDRPGQGFFILDEDDDPPPIEILPDDDDQSPHGNLKDYEAIAPADAHDIFEEDSLLEDPPSQPQKVRPKEGSFERADRAATHDDSFSDLEKPAFERRGMSNRSRLPAPSSVADLTPDELSRLIERAVERGMLNALTKSR